MCAAPGGKTIHLATLMQNEGLVVALEKTHQKAKRLMALFHSHPHLSNVEVHQADATHILSDLFPDASLHFDRILLDPPCSGLGHRPTLQLPVPSSGSWPEEMQRYVKYQRRLMEEAYKVLKTGGRWVYSTCTLHPAENEENVVWALQRFPRLRLVDARSVVGEQELKALGAGSGLTQRRVKGQMEAIWPDQEDALKVVKFDMSSEHTVGFFMACFIKV